MLVMFLFYIIYAHNAFLKGKPQIPRTGMCQASNALSQSEVILLLYQTPLCQQTLLEHDIYVL